MNGAILAAAQRLAAETAEREAREEARRTQQETLMAAASRSIALLTDGLKTLSELLQANIEPDWRFTRRAQWSDEARTEPFFLPKGSKYCPWYAPKQSGWYITTSADWDGALRLLGESDLRVAVLANGKTSRFLRLSDAQRRRHLARDIIEYCARHDLVWPADGPDLVGILEEDESAHPSDD